MPHLTYRKRYWRVAGDEFSIPALCSILSRIFWTILVSLTFALAFNSIVSCPGGWVVVVYLSVTLAFFLASIFCDAKLGLISLRGSIIEVEERAGLVFYLNLKMLLGFFQFAVAIFGLILISDTSSVPCAEDFDSSNVNRVFVGIVVFSQFVDVFTILCCCYCFMANRIDEAESKNMTLADDNLESGVHARGTEYAVSTWENRCRTLTRSIQIFGCNLFGGGNINEGFDEVAKVLTDFFHHDGFLDVVPSDVVAGIILVRLEQRAGRRKISAAANPQSDGECEEDGGGVDSAGIPLRLQRHASRHAAAVDAAEIHLDSEQLEVIARCVTFSLAMYTHLIYMFMKPITGPCTLCCGTFCSSEVENGQSCPHCAEYGCGRCCGCLRKSWRVCCCTRLCGLGKRMPLDYKREEIVNEIGRRIKKEGDNDCGLHQAGLQAMTKQLRESEMEYLSFKNDTNNKVFGVFLDHKLQQVVIAIRGTLSMEDCITDVICEPTEVNVTANLLMICLSNIRIRSYREILALNAYSCRL